MKKYITIIATSLGFIAYGLIATSCSAQDSDLKRHQPGPPSKNLPSHNH